MDNLTHSLVGLALARTGLNRISPRATLLLIISANAPDADVVSFVGGQLRHLEIHRGYTHSFIGLPFMAALSVLAVAAIYRQRLPWTRAWLLCVIGVASHLLLDWTNAYGVRLILPFSSQWFHADLNSLTDLWILAALLFAAVWPPFARLVSREIGDKAPTGRKSAFFALGFFVLFDCARTAMHGRSISQLESRLYNGAPPIELAALPNPFNPLRWRGIVETAADYRLMNVQPLGQLDPDAGRVFYKQPIGPAFQSAEQTEAFRYFLYFSRFPVRSHAPVSMEQGVGTRIDLVDLRFGEPGSGSLHAIALLNRSNQVLGSWFTYGTGSNLGWGNQPK